MTSLRFAVLAALGFSLLAQQPDAPQQPGAEQQTPVITQPVETPEQPEYTGPAILSRGTGLGVIRPSQPIKFRPYVTLNATYDNGLTGVFTDNLGHVPNERSYGGEASLGVYGYRRSHRSIVSLDYKGNYRYYHGNRYYNGSDQNLALSIQHELSRRVSIVFNNAAGEYNNSIAIRTYQATPLADIQGGFIPRNELFDARVFYVNTSSNVIYRKTPRLSFGFGGAGFLTRHRSTALYGYTGAQARADVAYRYSRRSTIGVAYFFDHFEFTRAFGASDIHGVAIQHSTRLSRWWELAVTAGAIRVETLGVQQVALDPVIAAIIGRTTGTEAVYRVNYAPSLSARLGRGFRRGSLQLSYSKGVDPGNGVFLTSEADSFTASYNYTGIRRWNIGVSAGYDTYSSLTRTLGKYRSFYGGVGVTRRVGRYLHFLTRFDARTFEITHTSFERKDYRVSMGFSFAPGDIPLRLF